MFCLYLLLWHGTPILLRKGYNRLSIKNNNAVTMSSRTWVGLWFSSKTPSLPPSLLSCFHWGHTNLEVLSSMDLNSIYGITAKTHICKTTVLWRVSRCGMASGGLCNVKLIGVQQRANIWVQDCSWASLPSELDDICTVPLPFLVSLQFCPARRGDRAISNTGPKHLFLCCNEHNFSIFFHFPVLSFNIMPSICSISQMHSGIFLEFLFAFRWSSVLQQSVEC